MAQPETVNDALIQALQFEAINQSLRGQAKVRALNEQPKELSLDEIVRRVLDQLKKKPRQVQCRNCQKMGHVQQQWHKSLSQNDKQSERLSRINRKGQVSTRTKKATNIVAQVASIIHRPNSIFINGAINKKPSAMLLDTGATKTIIRPDIIDVKRLIPSKWQLRTATGDSAKVRGETDATFTIGSYTFKHRVLVADIEDAVLLGMDIMSMHGFNLNLKRGIITVNNEEVIVQYGTDIATQAVLTADVTLPQQSETMVPAQLDDKLPTNSIVMLEPTSYQKGVLAARVLITVKKTMPVRLMNLNNFPVELKKGTILGHCSSVSSIVRNINTRPALSRELPTELCTLTTEACQGLSPFQKDQVAKLIYEYQDIFKTGKGPDGRTNIVRHKINTGDARPIRQAPRRLPLAKRDDAERLVQEMEQDDVIEASNSPWASPIVLVKKKDGSTRFCVDYRQLNNVTKKDSYPLPRIDDTLDTLAGAKLFSTLDLKSGYHQVELEQADREKTAFTMGTGLYQFKVMPFGLCNAPATFERLMETVLKGLSWKTCLVYLDDIIVIGRSFEDHQKNLKEVFHRLRSANLKLSPKKCHLFRKEVNYLGHVVSDKGVAADPEKVKAVVEWPIPADKHQVRSFLGLCTYYRRYVPGFANIAKPLTRLTEENRKFIWDQECQTAFEQLKQYLVTAPILCYPLSHGEFIVDTDASNVGIGGVLSQIQDGQEKVIGYFSKVLSKPERNYCVTRRELLAVIKSIEHFHKYLYGRKFHLRTDHAALKWLLNFKNPEGQIARWMERLQTYDFNIEHRSGVSHQNADALSRRPCPADCKHCSRVEEKAIPVLRTTVIDDQWQNDEMRQSQEQDPILSKLLHWKQTGQRPTWQEVAPEAPSLKSYWAQWDSLVLEDGLLKRTLENPNGTDSKKQLVVPRDRVADVLREIHDGSSGGHLGVRKTTEKLRERFYWVNSTEDVKDWCKKCLVCSASNGPQRRRKAPMRQYNVGSPFERIAIDIAGPFPETDDGNKYILVAMDYFSKWVEAYALPNQEAVTVAEVLVKELICRFGVPLELHSDQGRNFESAVFQNMCDILGIRKTRTTALHPQSDGMVERMNRTIGRYLSKVVSHHQRDWDRYLHLFLMAYRSSVHETTGQTPAHILFGRGIRLPCDLKFGCKPEEDLAGEDYVSDLRRRLDDIHDQVRSNIQNASDHMKETYDVKAEEGGYQAGDLVWLFNPQRRRGLSPKMQKSWEGPFEIIKRINDVIYRIRKSPNGKPRVVHFNRLAPFAGQNPEEQINRVQALHSEPTFEEFMHHYDNERKARFGVTKEVQQDLFTVPEDYSLAHCVASDVKMIKGIAVVFQKKYNHRDRLNRQKPSVGQALEIVEQKRSIFYLITKELSHHKPTYRTLWEALLDLRSHLLRNNILKLAIPKLGCGLDGLNWRTVRNMLEIIFQHTGIEVLVCSYHPGVERIKEKSVDCYFYKNSTCKYGEACRYRHAPMCASLFRDETFF